MGYGMKLKGPLLREKVRKIGPFRRENKTILCRRYGRSLNDEASDVLVPALSTYGVSGRDIPKQVANYSKQQRQQQVSDWFSSEFLFLSENRHVARKNLPELASDKSRYQNLERNSRKEKYKRTCWRARKFGSYYR